MSGTTPQGYDPVLLFHWLWWRVLCLEAGGEAFEELFKKVVIACSDDFVPVRPYGNIGDRKCDGLLWGDGVIYQVYSPDELKQAAMVRKVEEDLAGAVEHWGNELRRWVFVYNVRRGVAPDVVRMLLRLRDEHPALEIELLSDRQIWERVSSLPINKRVEILGAPAGYEHVFLMPSAVPEEVRARLAEGRFVVIHDAMTPINVMDAVQAMDPEGPFGPPYRISPSYASWSEAAAYQEAMVAEAMRRAKDLLPRFAVFSLSPIPLAIHLGHLLSDRVDARLFQFDRERMTWAWDPEPLEGGDSDFQITGLPEARVEGPTEVIVRISLSARIAPHDTATIVSNGGLTVDLAVSQPDVKWLRHPAQLTALGRAFRDLLREVNELVPAATVIHLLYAGPTAGAIMVGQAINPRMNPPVALYEFDRRKDPRYEQVMVLS